MVLIIAKHFTWRTFPRHPLTLIGASPSPCGVPPCHVEMQVERSPCLSEACPLGTSSRVAVCFPFSCSWLMTELPGVDQEETAQPLWLPHSHSRSSSPLPSHNATQESTRHREAAPKARQVSLCGCSLGAGSGQPAACRAAATLRPSAVMLSLTARSPGVLLKRTHGAVSQ